MKLKSLLSLSAALVLTGCQTTDPYTGESQNSNATSGAIAGAVTGAIIGGASSSRSDRGRGMLIGAAAGSALGGGIGHYMDQQEAELRQRLQGSGVQVKREGDQIELVMPGNITFDTSRYDIQSSFFETLNSVAIVLNEFDETQVEVLGHTDSTGSLEYNQTLSENRAKSVAAYLSGQGISATRLSSAGFGPSQPVASNNTEEGRSQNRRVEIRIRAQGS